MKCLKTPLLAAAVALVGAGLAAASPITTPGLTVTSGPLTFSNFTCSFNASGNYAGACSTISVDALTPQPTGIQFSTNLAVLGVSSADAALTFNLTSTQGISNVGLSFNSNFLGMDINSVTENVYTSNGGALVGSAVVHCGVITGCAATTTDSIALNGSYTSLYITKDINLASFDGNSSGTTSIITQTFATPEPMSMSLIGAGLAVLGLARVRKNRKA